MTHCGNIFVYLQYTWFLIVNLTNNLLTGFFCYLFSNFGTRHTDLRINVEKYVSCKKTAEYEKKNKKNLVFCALCKGYIDAPRNFPPKNIFCRIFMLVYLETPRDFRLNHQFLALFDTLYKELANLFKNF